MTDLLERAIERVRSFSPEMQGEVAGVMLPLTGEDDEIYQLAPEEEADLAGAEDEIARGDFATDFEVSAVFCKYGRHGPC